MGGSPVPMGARRIPGPVGELVAHGADHERGGLSGSEAEQDGAHQRDPTPARCDR